MQQNAQMFYRVFLAWPPTNAIREPSRVGGKVAAKLSSVKIGKHRSRPLALAPCWLPPIGTSLEWHRRLNRYYLAELRRAIIAAVTSIKKEAISITPEGRPSWVR